MKSTVGKYKYAAFNIRDQIQSKAIVHVPFTDQDPLVKYGRVSIKDRIRSFHIDIFKNNMDHQDFEILVS